MLPLNWNEEKLCFFLLRSAIENFFQQDARKSMRRVFAKALRVFRTLSALCKCTRMRAMLLLLIFFVFHSRKYVWVYDDVVAVSVVDCARNPCTKWTK